jgi:hypothetical protein
MTLNMIVRDFSPAECCVFKSLWLTFGGNAFWAGEGETPGGAGNRVSYNVDLSNHYLAVSSYAGSVTHFR